MKGHGMKAGILGVISTTALLALGGCSSMGAFSPSKWWGNGPQEQAMQRLAGATLYQCAGGKQFAVRYTGERQSQAMIILPEREFRLDQAAAGSGVRYTNGRTTLISKGDEVELEEGGSMLFASCKRAA